MTYQVLARKWRPRSFESLVGQEHVVRALTHALSEQRLHHAYLFTGTRGVGKTTLARILAKSLNCERGVSATPCGVCDACVEIDSGRFVDLLEVDAATNTKVDEMRQLLENAVYAPTRGRFKVYVIDEVHMLSNSAFNAMLKTLEEPPEHVKFILATTDPQKIPVTVLSRCLQFNLKQMTPPLIAAHLKKVLEIEAISAESAALNLIAHSAAGSMRDALSLLDQAIAHGAGKVEESEVRAMLGSVDLDYLLSIFDALLANDVAAMLAVADTMQVRSLSFDTALQEMARLLTQIQVAQLAPAALADDLPDRERILSLALAMDCEFVQLAYQIAIHGRQELALAPDDYAGFAMCLLRLHTFRPLSADVAPSGATPPPTAQPAPKTPAHKPLSATPPQSLASEKPPWATPENPAASTYATSTASVPLTPSAPAVSSTRSSFSPSNSPPLAPQTIQESTPLRTGEPAPNPEFPTTAPNWHDLLPQLALSGMAKELASHCEIRSMNGHCIDLRLPPTHRYLQIPSAQERIQTALNAHFGQPIELQWHLEAPESATPAEVTVRIKQQQQNEAVAAIEQDEVVRELIERFDAHILPSTITPRQFH